MGSRFYGGGDNKRYQKMLIDTQINFLVPRVYASIACALWNRGSDEKQIEDLFAESQEYWRDSQANGWDMLQNVQDVTGIKVKYFKDTGNIV